MKKTLLAIAATLSFGYANAQIKLGNNPTTTNSNALLELETTNKGLLLPRVALTSTTSFAPLTAHIAGMAVYNTATTGDVTSGYYFDNGTAWVRIADANAVKTDSLQVVAGAGAGKVLTSDASGHATWAPPAAAKPVTFIPTTPFNSANITGFWSKLTNGRTGYKAQLGIFSFTLANASDVMASAVINGGIPCAGCPDDNGATTLN